LQNVLAFIELLRVIINGAFPRAPILIIMAIQRLWKKLKARMGSGFNFVVYTRTHRIASFSKTFDKAEISCFTLKNSFPIFLLTKKGFLSIR